MHSYRQSPAAAEVDRDGHKHHARAIKPSSKGLTGRIPVIHRQTPPGTCDTFSGTHRLESRIFICISRGEAHMTNLAGTIRYSLRQFRQSPVFTSAAILTLALGIGGTTAIFTLIHAVMLRSLPVSDPSLLYRIGDGDDCCVM